MLGEHRAKRVKELSGGMKRKLSLALAIVTKPRLLILDEPTSGLDVESRQQLWELIKKLKCQLKLFGRMCSGLSPKSFRAGRVTAIMKIGDPLGQVMLAGEWKSLSVLRYVNEEVVDPYRILDMQLEASDNEASAEDDDKSDDG